MAENKVDADIRTSFGKGAARKLRMAGKIPAVVYGHGAEPLHVAVPAHETTLIARRANALLDLKMPDDQQLVLINRNLLAALALRAGQPWRRSWRTTGCRYSTVRGRFCDAAAATAAAARAPRASPRRFRAQRGFRAANQK